MQETLAKTSADVQREARARAYAMPLSEFHVGNPELFRTDTLWPYFERLRKEEPVHWCSTSPVGNYWSVTKYNDIVQCREPAGDLLLRRAARRHHAARRRCPLRMAELHRHGRPRPCRAARRRAAAVHAARAGQDGGADPRALGLGARPPAAQRNLQLGRARVDRAHHADAGDAVRFSLGRAEEAHALVGHGHRAAQERRLCQ